MPESVRSYTVIAMIPARYGATRFPGKLMRLLGNKPVIRHTYEATLATGLFNEVVVVTDSELIYSEISSAGGRVIMSRYPHVSGTDRIAEAAEELTADIIVNVQGDTPFIKKECLRLLLNTFEDQTVRVSSLMQELTDPKDIQDPNFVKVVVDNNMNALFFSRSPVPFPRDKDIPVTYYEHIGVYAFRKTALLDFVRWPESRLESIEKIECLRFLENGVSLRMVPVDYMGVEIDTPEDLEKASRLL